MSADVCRGQTAKSKICRFIANFLLAPLKKAGRRFETSTGASKPGDQGGARDARLPFVQILPARLRFPAVICRVREGSMQKVMELLKRCPDTRLRTDPGGGKRRGTLSCGVQSFLCWADGRQLELGASLIAIFGLAIFDWGG